MSTTRKKKQSRLSTETLQIEELTRTLRWIVERIESEADKVLECKRPNWKAASCDVVEEAYGMLACIYKENDI